MADDLNESLGATAKLQEKIKELNKSIEASLTEQNSLLDSQQAKAENLSKYAQQTVNDTKKTKEIAKERIEILNREIDQANSLMEKQKKLGELQDEQINLLEQERDLRMALGESTVDLEEAIKKAKKEQEKFNEELEKGKELADGLFDGFSNLAKGNLTAGLMGIGKAIAGPKIKKGIAAAKNGIQGLASAGAGGAAALGGLGASLLAVGIAAEVWKKIFKLAIEVMDAQSAFMKATGASREFASSLTDVTREARRFGGSAKDVGESMQALFTGVSDFSMMSSGARKEITKNAVALSKLGVSNQDFARGSQVAIKAMAQTGVQAAATQREIAALGMDIGVAPSKMASDFANAGPKLAKFGSDGVQAFKDLAVAAKVTGIAVDRLLSITEKFDTFEGAATQAGKLNAALGGNFVNAMELVTATDPVERMKMIRESILDAGLSFDEMSYYQRKFFAESAGLADEAELAALMSGNMDSLAGNIGKTSKEYADMAEQAAKVQDFQDKLNTLMMALIPVVEPLVDILVSLSDWMMENLDIVKGGFLVLTGVVTGLAVAMTILAGATLAATLPVWGIPVAIGAAIAAIAALASLLFVDSFASSFLEGLYKIGDGFGFIGEMAKFAVSPISGVIDTMSKLGGEMFGGSESVLVGAKMTTEGLAGIGDASAKTASQVNAAAPVMATSSAVSNAMNNSTTNNYNGSGAESNVNIKFDNKKFADLFDVQVEKSIGRAARKAVI